MSWIGCLSNRFGAQRLFSIMLMAATLLLPPTSLRARFRRDFDDHTGMICVSGRIVPAMALTGQLLRQRVGRRLFIVKAMEGWLTGSALVGVVPGVIFPGTF